MVILNYVGPFISLNVLQTNYPNGGKDGDYADISGRNYYWVSTRGKWIPEYGSVSALTEEVLNPQKSDLAFVGTSNPLAIYIYNGAEWINSGESVDIKPSITAPFVQVGDYNRDKNELNRSLKKKVDKTVADDTYATKTEMSTKANSKDVTSALSGKVDKNGNKQLSDENFTLSEKQKLAGIANGATAFSGSYNDLRDKPDIPTSVEELSGTEKFLTAHQDITGKADIVPFSEYIKEEVIFEQISYGGKDALLCYYAPLNKFCVKVLQLGTAQAKYYYSSFHDPLSNTTPVLGSIYKTKTQTYIGTSYGLKEFLDYDITETSGGKSVCNPKDPETGQKMYAESLTELVVGRDGKKLSETLSEQEGINASKVDKVMGKSLISDSEIQRLKMAAEIVHIGECITGVITINSQSTEEDGELCYYQPDNTFIWKTLMIAGDGKRIYYRNKQGNSYTMKSPVPGATYVCGSDSYIASQGKLVKAAYAKTEGESDEVAITQGAATRMHNENKKLIEAADNSIKIQEEKIKKLADGHQVLSESQYESLLDKKPDVIYMTYEE